MSAVSIPAGTLPGDYVSGAELSVLPLGGAGEIGMNLTLYGCDGTWLMVDLGITFGDDTTPGVDVLMPDPAFIVAQRDRLAGLVLTHAHEDHLGAVPYLWSRLNCPVYATPFAAAMLRRKLAEAGLLDEVPLYEIPLSGGMDIGPFRLSFITLTHSIPEPNALAIETPYGRVLHTGDWKLDPDPLVGKATDEKALSDLGRAGVLAMVCDSTNALRPGEAGSEADVRDSLRKIIADAGAARVVATCFASNLARLLSLARIGRECGRDVGLVGRSLWRIVEIARETGYLPDDITFVSERDIGLVPDEHAMIICTGCQGEPRSALYRMATDAHPRARIHPGDLVIFSSRIIPGNEKPIGRLQSLIRRQGARVLTEKDGFIHVSGHPAEDELARMYGWVKPAIAVPVHGEWRHLRRHAELARNWGAREAFEVENGDVLRLAPGPAAVVAQVPAGRLCLDGARVVPFGGKVVRDRQKLLFNGAAVATIVLGADRMLAAPLQLSLQGVLEEEAWDSAREAAETAVKAALEATVREGDDVRREAARRAIRRSLFQATGRKPMTDIHLLHLPNA